MVGGGGWWSKVIFVSNPTFELSRGCNTLKIKVFEKSILFCKYLRDESSDRHEISHGGQLLSCELKFHKDPCTNARAQVVNARAHVLLRVGQERSL